MMPHRLRPVKASLLDQIRTIDKSRLISKIGTTEAESQAEVISILQSLFVYWAGPRAELSS